MLGGAPWRIPADVNEWLRKTFLACNERVSGKLSRLGNVWESSLDMTVIEHFSEVTVPYVFSSGWVVRIDVHYLGGGRHWNGWEVADIGLLVTFVRGTTILQTKVALLQSKRLYPDEVQRESEDSLETYEVGIARLLPIQVRTTQKRNFTFTNDSRYRAMEIEDHQYSHIRDYERAFNIPVFYLFYNPWRIPYQVTIPVTASRAPRRPCKVGMRVVPASSVFGHFTAADKGAHPSHKDVASIHGFTQAPDVAGWRFEDFVVDHVLTCRQGYVASQAPEIDAGLRRVLTLREGPIAAAISITIKAPDGG